MSGIFISYRREDADAWAGRVYERLSKDFGPEQIFIDVDNLAPGLDFVEELERQVGQCSKAVPTQNEPSSPVGTQHPTGVSTVHGSRLQPSG